MPGYWKKSGRCDIRVDEHRGECFGYCVFRAFEYLVAYSGGYRLPFIPMVVLLCLGTLLWAKFDPTHELFAEQPPEIDEQKNVTNRAS